MNAKAGHMFVYTHNIRKAMHVHLPWPRSACIIFPGLRVPTTLWPG